MVTARAAPWPSACGATLKTATSLAPSTRTSSTTGPYQLFEPGLVVVLTNPSTVSVDVAVTGETGQIQPMLAAVLPVVSNPAFIRDEPNVTFSLLTAGAP